MGLTQERGKHGEDLAAAFLLAHGFRILARNARTPFGEIDLVCRDGQTVVFVEVRYRASTAFGQPEETVLGRKLDRMRQSAEWYVTAHKLQGAYRLDVIGIAGKPPRPTHLQDV
jgi:putative endonuclease